MKKEYIDKTTKDIIESIIYDGTNIDEVTAYYPENFREANVYNPVGEDDRILLYYYNDIEATIVPEGSYIVKLLVPENSENYYYEVMTRSKFESKYYPIDDSESKLQSFISLNTFPEEYRGLKYDGTNYEQFKQWLGDAISYNPGGCIEYRYFDETMENNISIFKDEWLVISTEDYMPYRHGDEYMDTHFIPKEYKENVEDIIKFLNSRVPEVLHDTYRKLEFIRSNVHKFLDKAELPQPIEDTMNLFISNYIENQIDEHLTS